MTITRRLLYTVLLAVLTLRCASTTNKPPKAPENPSLGIFYRLPKTVVEVQSKRSEIMQVLLKDNELRRDGAVEVTGEVTGRTIPDASRTLDLKSGALADGSLTVTISPEGYLQGVNSTIEGKTGSVLSNIFQIAGRVLGVLALFGAQSDARLTETVVQPPAVACAAGDLPADVVAVGFHDGRPSPHYFGADKLGLYFVNHSAIGCEKWKAHLQATINVRDQARRVQREEAALKGTATSAEAKEIEEKIHHATVVLRRFQATEAEKAGEYDAALADFKKTHKMTPETTSLAMREAFELHEIPPVSLVNTLTKFDATSIEVALSNYPRMASMLKAGAFVTVLDPVPAPPQNASAVCKDGIAYREPMLVRLAVFQEEKDGKVTAFKKKDEKVITAFSSAIGCIKVEQSNIANRALVLEFGDYGVPKKLARTNTSSAAAATAAVGTALTSLQDTYAASLEKVIAIQTSRRTISTSDLADQIARATKQKELVDAQIAFEGATASKELVLEQKLTEQRLALLQKQLELSKTEQGTAAQLEIALLTDRITVLEKQLALILAQQKVDEANRQP